MPLLSKEDGRVVFVASGSGPDAFSGCSQAMQARVRGADTRVVRDNNTQLDHTCYCTPALPVIRITCTRSHMRDCVTA